jgi:hypothetical protein
MHRSLYISLLIFFSVFILIFGIVFLNRRVQHTYTPEVTYKQNDKIESKSQPREIYNPTAIPVQTANADFVLKSKAPLNAEIFIPKDTKYEVDRNDNTENDVIEGYHVKLTLNSGVIMRFCWGCIPIIFPNDQVCRDPFNKYKSDNILGGCSTKNINFGRLEFEEFYSLENPNELEFALYTAKSEGLYSVTIDPGEKRSLTAEEIALITKISDSVKYSNYLR